MISPCAPLNDVNKLLFNLLVFRSLCNEESATCFSWSQKHCGKLVIEVSCKRSASADRPWEGIADTLHSNLSVVAVTAEDFFVVVDEAEIQKGVQVPEVVTTSVLTAQVYVNRFSHKSVINCCLELCKDYVVANANDTKIKPGVENDESVVDAIVKENTVHVLNARRSAAARNRYVKQYSSKLLWIPELYRQNSEIRLDLFDHIYQEADYLCTPRLNCSQLKNFFPILVPSQKDEDAVYLYLIGNARSPSRALRKVVSKGTSLLKEIGNNPEIHVISAMLGLDAHVVRDRLREWNFVLTDAVAYKMVLLHHRKMAGIPVIIEGETGVGKTYLLEMYAQLMNAGLIPNLKCRVAQWIEGQISDLFDGKGEEQIGKTTVSEVVQQLQQMKYDTCDLPPLLEDLLKVSEEDLQCKIIDLLRAKITEWYDSTPVLKAKPTQVTELLYRRKPLSIPEASQLLHNFLETPVHPVFNKLLLHPGVTQQDIKRFLQPVINAATDEKLKELKLVVFFDEMNTSKCLGMLKEIFCDHSLDGATLPTNIFFTAAINPFTGLLTEEHAAIDGPNLSQGIRSIPVHRHVYHVFKLPESMADYVWVYRGMKSSGLEQYLKAKTDLALDAIVSVWSREGNTANAGGDKNLEGMEKELRSCGRLVIAAQAFCKKTLGKGSVSQRDVKRTFQLVAFFWTYLPLFWNVDDYVQRIRIVVQLSVGVVYYLRLSLDTDEDASVATRGQFSVEVDKVIGSGYGIEIVMTIAVEKFVTYEHFKVPKGIALTRALRENIFTIVACVVSKVPLGIIGIPGSSKTLSVHIVRDNLRGPHQSHTDFCKNIPAVDVIFHQCSEYSTSEEIENTFRKAIRRQTSYGDKEASSTRCVVFLDEAGLPREKIMVLKVLHAFLDNPEVSFVAVSNFLFDAANSNRMVTLRRSLDPKDLEVLARGCLGIDHQDQNSKGSRFGEGLCQGFRCVQMDAAFRQMFHYRDFIYTLLYIRWNAHSVASDFLAHSFVIPSPTVVLWALEENMNGVGQQEFIRLLEVFFEGIQRVLGRDYCLPVKDLRRETEILGHMLGRDVDKSLASGERFGSRFVMVIDPSEDETATIRMLFDSGLLRQGNQQREVRLIGLSDFESDVTSLSDAETLARLRFALAEPCTAVLQNTNRINGALYDLFNQTFSIMAEAEEGKPRKVYANIALGEFTYPCQVHPSFKCVVIVRESDLSSTPSPFLSRFSKFRLSAEDFLALQQEEMSDLALGNQLKGMMKELPQFIDQLGLDALFGLTDKHTATAQILVSYICQLRKTKLDSPWQLILDNMIKTGIDQCESTSNSEDATKFTLCARLLQLAPPEVAILALEKISRKWRKFFMQVYFDMQEHFSLDQLIKELETASKPSVDLTTLSGGSKLLVYARYEKSVNDLCRQFSEPHQDWCIFDGTSIHSAKKIINALLEFISSGHCKVFLMIIPPVLASQFTLMRLILQLLDDAYQYTSTGQTRGMLDMSDIEYNAAEMNNKTFALLLPHRQESESSDTVHPAQFLDGWNTFFLDLSETDDAVESLTYFTQLLYGCDHSYEMQSDDCHDEFHTKGLLSKWLLGDEGDTFWDFFRPVCIHEEFREPLTTPAHQLYSRCANVADKRMALQEILSIIPELEEVSACKFSSSPFIATAMKFLLRRLALDVFTKKRCSSISTLVDHYMKVPFLTYCRHFFCQIGSDFGLSTLLDWKSYSVTEETIRSFLMIVRTSCDKATSMLQLFGGLLHPVPCSTEKPFKTPLFELLAGWLASLSLPNGESDDNDQVDLVSKLQSQLRTDTDARIIVDTIDNSDQLLKGWILDLIWKAVALETSDVISDDILYHAVNFVMIKCNSTSFKFASAFRTVDCNNVNVVDIIHGSRALAHLGMLQEVEVDETYPQKYEEVFWTQTVRVLNSALIDQQRVPEWTAAVSLVLPAFSSLSKFRSKELKAGMKLMLLLYGILRSSMLAVDSELLSECANYSASGRSSFSLTNVLSTLYALSKRSTWLSLQENLKKAVADVLFWYFRYRPSGRGSKHDQDVLLEGLEQDLFLEESSDHVSLVLDTSTKLSLLMIEWFHNSARKGSAAEDQLELPPALTNLPENYPKLKSLWNEVYVHNVEAVLAEVERQLDASSCPVLAIILKSFPVLKRFRDLFLSATFLQKWAYEVSSLYSNSLEDTMEDVISRFVKDGSTSEVDKQRVSNGMDSIEILPNLLLATSASDLNIEKVKELRSISLKQCLKTLGGDTDGYFFDLIEQLAGVQKGVIHELRRYVQRDQADVDWSLMFGQSFLTSSVSLFHIIATEGLSLISLDERRFLCLIQFCSKGDSSIDLCRLERLVIETFLQNARDIDVESLRPQTAFVPLENWGCKLRSLKEDDLRDIEPVTDLWLNTRDQPEDAPIGNEDDSVQDVIQAVEGSCKKFDVIDREYHRRLQPYRRARKVLQESGDLLDQHPDQPISFTLEVEKKLDLKLADDLLAKMPEQVRGSHRILVLKLISRYESCIREEQYKASTDGRPLWPLDKTPNVSEEEKQDFLKMVPAKPLGNPWKLKIDRRTSGPAESTLLEEDEVREDTSVSSESSDEADGVDKDESATNSDSENEPIDDNVDLGELVREEALHIWTTSECSNQSVTQFKVFIEAPPQPSVTTEGLQSVQQADVYEVRKGLRGGDVLVSQTLCTRSVVDQMVAVKLASSGLSTENVGLSNSVGLVLSDGQRPLHDVNSPCTLYLVSKKVRVEIILLMWRKDSDPLRDCSFATINREFSSESTVEDLFVTVLLYANEAVKAPSSINTKDAVMHYKDGIVIPNQTTTTLSSLRLDPNSPLYCTFGCPYIFRCMTSKGHEQFKVLPNYFKRAALSRLRSSREAVHRPMEEVERAYLFWIPQRGEKIEGVRGEELLVYVIPWKAVFYIVLISEGNTEHKYLPVLHTSTLQSLCRNEEPQAGLEQSETYGFKIKQYKANNDQSHSKGLFLKPVPVGWNCGMGTRLVREPVPSWGTRIVAVLHRFSATVTERFIVEVPKHQQQTGSDLLSIIARDASGRYSNFDAKRCCLIHPSSRVVIEDLDSPICSGPTALDAVELCSKDSVAPTCLQVFRYDFLSGRRIEDGEVPFQFSNQLDEITSWANVRDFLALQHQHKFRRPFTCALPPFLTFVGCNVVIENHSDFGKLLQCSFDLSIGFWDGLKDDELIPMTVDFPTGDQLAFKLGKDSSSETKVCDLLGRLCKLEEQVEYKCFLTLDGEKRLPNSSTLAGILAETDMPIKFRLIVSDVLTITVRYQDRAIPFEMNATCGIRDAITDALLLFGITDSSDLFSLFSCGSKLTCTDPGTPFLDILEGNRLDPQDNEFELIPVVDTVWIGRQGFAQLCKLEHPSFSSTDEFLHKAASLVNVDPTHYQLILTDEIPVNQATERLEDILVICKRQQFLHEGKPVVRLAKRSMHTSVSHVYNDSAVSTEPRHVEEDLDHVPETLQDGTPVLEELIPLCAPRLWKIEEYRLLSEDEEINVDVFFHGQFDRMEDLQEDDHQKKLFFVYDLEKSEGQKSDARQFYCKRSQLYFKVANDRKRRRSPVSDDVGEEDVSLATKHGLIVTSDETVQSHEFTVIPNGLKCLVGLHFREFRTCPASDWNYSALFRGDGDMEERAKSPLFKEREVYQNVTLSKLAEIAISLWRSGVNKDNEVRGAVVHFDDGSVPDPEQTVSNLSEEQRLSLWISVGCRNSMAIDGKSAVIPDHLPIRLLQDFQQRQLSIGRDFQGILDSFFVWPSYRVLLSKATNSSTRSLVFVIPRSPKAVYVVKATKHTKEEVLLPVMPTTTCQSVANYLSLDANLPICLFERGKDQPRLLPPSLPLGHIAAPTRTFRLQELAPDMTISVFYHKRSEPLIEKGNATVSELFRKACTQDKLKKDKFSLVDPRTRCQLPDADPKDSDSKCSNTRTTEVTMRSLNISRVEVVPKENLDEITMQVFRYSKSGAQSFTRSNTRHLVFSVQRPSSEPKRVSWQLLAAFLGSTTKFTGTGPFNCPSGPFLTMNHSDSGRSVIMVNPDLDIGKFLSLARDSEKYQLSIGYWEEIETGPLMDIVIQCYNPKTSMTLQVEHGTAATIRDVAEAISLQTGRNQSTCVLLRGNFRCSRSVKLSSLSEGEEFDSEQLIRLRLEILDDVAVHVHFCCETRDPEVIIANVSDRPSDIIGQSLEKFHITAPTELFQLSQFDNDRVRLNSFDSVQSFLEDCDTDPLDVLSFLLQPVEETFVITVEGWDAAISVCHPRFSTLEKFVDSIATNLKEQLKIEDVSTIELYWKSENGDVNVDIDDDRLDQFIEAMTTDKKNNGTVAFAVRLCQS